MDVYQKLGLTPIYARLATHYLAKGVGEYSCDSMGYERVVVTVDRPWNNYAHKDDPSAYFMVYRVEFHAEGRLEKWFEFKATMTGGGSTKSTGFEVHDNTEDTDDTD